MLRDALAQQYIGLYRNELSDLLFSNDSIVALMSDDSMLYFLMRLV